MKINNEIYDEMAAYCWGENDCATSNCTVITVAVILNIFFIMYFTLINITIVFFR